MKIKLVFHGDLKKYNKGIPEKEIDIEEGTTISQLIRQSTVPNKEVAFAAVNGTRVPESCIIEEHDVVKLFQFVVGG
jgi:sulfur carrier protein ThiS